MRTHRLVRRFAAVSIMVASAALPAGVAHSADNGTAPSVTTQTANIAKLVDVVPAPAPVDLGLPEKPTGSVGILRASAAAALVKVAAAQTPVVAPASDPAPAAPPATTRKTTTKTVSTTPAKTTTAPKTTAPAAPAGGVVAPPATSGSVTARQDLASAVAAATNAQRTAAGLKPLAYRSCSVPASWALHMASAGSLTHNSLTTVLSACGGTTTAGENIAAGYTSVAAVTAGWMGSAGHKANILNPNFKIISVGVAQAANGTYYWVEDFTG